MSVNHTALPTPFNATAEHQKLATWVPNVAAATVICFIFASSLVCYLVWLGSGKESTEANRVRSRSNSSEGAFNPIFVPTKRVVLTGGELTQPGVAKKGTTNRL